MCLIVIAHLASERFPLVIAANRDEDYDRPTITAAPWEEDAGVVGGRDVLHGGSWLAVSASGRFAAVTNLRGGVVPEAGRSRGLLVRDFVLSVIPPAAYVASVAESAAGYAGFHLIAGELGDEAIHFSRAATQLQAGVHGLSNAQPGERWPKIETAVSRVRESLAITSRDRLASELLGFLSTRTGRGAVESEVFIATDRYGTRSSTVVIATRDEIAFYEQNFAKGGLRDGELRRFILRR